MENSVFLRTFATSNKQQTVMNRLKIIFAAWALLLACVTIFGVNTHCNVCIILGGLLASVLAAGYVLGHENEVEKAFIARMKKNFCD